MTFAPLVALLIAALLGLNAELGENIALAINIVSNDQNLWMALGEVTLRGAPSRG